MRPMSKFFTPPLLETDRRALYQFLGLENFGFFFVEKLGDLVLSHRRVRGGTLVPLLETPAEKNFDADGTLPTFTLEYTSYPPPVQAIGRTTGLWEDLFPFPFSRLIGSPESNPRVVGPASATAALRKLYDAISNLEEQMAQTELSLLWAKRGEARFPVLVHYVRYRRVRLGTSPELLARVSDWEKRQAPISELESQFGTRLDFLPLTIEATPQGIPALTLLAERFTHLSDTKVAGRPGFPPPVNGLEI